MRRGGRLWMVTLRDRTPESYEELPMYFRKRRAAQEWAEWSNERKDTDAWSWREDDVLAVFHAPDDVTAADVEWDGP